MTTAEIIAPVMHRTYGDGGMVNAAIGDVANFIDNYKAGYRGFEHELTIKLWDWFSGGDTATSTASKIVDAIGNANLEEAL